MLFSIFTNIVHQIFYYKHLPLDRKLSTVVSVLKMTKVGVQVVEWLERMPYTQPTLVQFRPEVLYCMSHPPLSPIFPICLLLNKGVYAKKKIYIYKMTNGWIPLSCLSFRVLVLYTLADSHTEGQQYGFVSFSRFSFPSVTSQTI